MGLQRNAYPLMAHDNSCVKVVGKFVTAGTSSPSVVISKGIDTVTRTGVGVLTFTIPGKGPIVTLSAVTNGLDMSSISVNDATRVATVNLFVDTGVAADSTGAYIYFVITIKNSSTRS